MQPGGKAAQGVPLGSNQVTALRKTAVSTEKAAEKLGEFLKNEGATEHLDSDHKALLEKLSTSIQEK
jgi:hypothetical protein